MEHSEKIDELGAALSKAQGILEAAKKDSNNPFFKSKYADLASVWESCRAALSSNGLSIVQSPEESDSGIAVVTMMLHSSGQWIRSRYTMPVSKVDAQAVGSAITYARRYALSSIVGIAPEDDDGNGAAEKPPTKQQSQQEKKPVQKQETKTLPPYSDESFAANKEKWAESIKAGKNTAQVIISIVSTKYALSEEQKETIRLLGAIDANS